MAFTYPNTWDVRYSQGGLIVGPGLTVTSDGKLVVTSGAGGTVTSITAGAGLLGGTINTSGTIALRPPTGGVIGGVKQGANINIAPDGTISAVLPAGTGTVTGVFAGPGLSGGGVAGGVTLSLNQATATTLGGVVVGPSLSVAAGVLNAPNATTTTRGQVRLATNAETVAGALNTVAVTPQSLANKLASTSAYGLTILSNSVASTSSTQAATSAAVKTAYDAALAAQTTAAAALPKSGGVMTGVITFAPGQTFTGVGLPVATTTSLGVVIPSTGLSVSPSGYLTTVNNGTVKSVTAGTGLGAPATGNTITNTGTLRLLAPTTDGLTIGGVKKGTCVDIAADGTISAVDVIKTNRPYAYNSYVFPLEVTPGVAPGTNGSFLRLVNNVTGEVDWAVSTGVTSVTAGTGLNTGFTGVTPNPNPITTAGIINLADTAVVPGSYGVTGVHPTFTVDQQGRLTSAGTAFPFSPFQVGGVTGAVLQLDLALNATNWEYTLAAATTVANPLNVVSGMRGTLIIRQNAITPQTIAWGSAWKFAYNESGNVTGLASAVDVFDWVAYSGSYIYVTSVARNVGPAGSSVQPVPTLVAFDSVAGSFNGTSTVFNLSIAGAAAAPSPASNFLVFLNGVQQNPGTQYTVTGTTIIFAVAPTAGTRFNAYTVL